MKDKSIEKGMEYIKEELAKPKLVWDEEEKLERMKTIWINGLQIAVTSAREETDLVLIENIRDWLINNIEYKLPDMLELFDKRFLPKRDSYIQSKNIMKPNKVSNVSNYADKKVERLS